MPDAPSLAVWLRAQIQADRDRHQAGWYSDTHWRMLRNRAALGAWTASRRNGVTSALNDEIADAGLDYLRELFDEWQTDHAKQFVADLDAKLRIVDLHTGGHECSGYDHQGEIDNCRWYHDFETCSTLRLIAVPYAGRDGYRDGWRVE